MLNAITPIASTAGGGNAQIAYLNEQENFQETVQSDQINYFAQDESKAEFLGKGAERLGIKGDIKNFSEVESLAEGFHPSTGKKLAYNAGANHDKGFEFALSADKTVSLLGMLGTPEQQKAVRDAHCEAVKEACAFIESLDLARKGKNGMVKMEGELVFSVFHHNESRELDPQIHSHVILNNLSFADGKWGSLDSKPFYENSMAVGQIYQNTLANELTKRGIAIEAKPLEKGIACAIKGMPEKLAETFSKRSQQIANYLSENGLADTRANRQIATLETRAAKQKGAELDSLKDDWRREAAAAGFDPEAIERAIQGQSATDFGEFKNEEVLSRFNDSVMTTHGSKATKANLLFSSLQEAFGKASTAEAKNAVSQLLEGPEIVRIDGKRITTKALVSAEEKLLDWGSKTRESNTIKDKGSAAKAKEVVMAMSKKPFTAEQNKAIDEILFNPRNIINIQGKAGTGKSSILKAVALAATIEGKATYGTATAGKAATSLEGCGMTAVENTAKLLHQLNRGGIKLNQGDFVICDEVGMLNTGQYEALAAHCEKAGAKLIAVGDYEQLQAIGAGGMHKLLCEKLGAVELTQVFRQTDAAEAQAGLQISAGNAAEAIKLYKDEGRYTVAATKAAMGRELAKNFTESPAAYDEKIAIADTRGQARDISKNIHNIRKEKGELGQCHSIEIKDPNEKSEQPLRQEFAPGDRIAFLKGSKAANPITGKDGKPAKVENGHFGTITKIEKTEKGFNLTVNHDKLGEVKLSTDTYNTFSLGYCVTTHKSQGATMRECHYATERPDKHKAYVGATRHTDKGGFHLYTTKAADKELADRMAKANYNESAVEAIASVKRKQQEAEAAKARVADRKARKTPELSRVKAEQPKLPERRLLSRQIESLGAAMPISAARPIGAAMPLAPPMLNQARPIPERPSQESIALAKAIFKRDFGGAIAALKEGASLTIITKEKENLLHLAAWTGALEKMRALLEKRVKPGILTVMENAVSARTDRTPGAIYQALHGPKDPKANYNAKLLYAAKHGDEIGVMEAIRHGGNIYQIDHHGRELAEIALESGSNGQTIANRINEAVMRHEAERATTIEKRAQQPQTATATPELSRVKAEPKDAAQAFIEHCRAKARQPQPLNSRGLPVEGEYLDSNEKSLFLKLANDSTLEVPYERDPAIPQRHYDFLKGSPVKLTAIPQGGGSWKAENGAIEGEARLAAHLDAAAKHAQPLQNNARGIFGIEGYSEKLKALIVSDRKQPMAFHAIPTDPKTGRWINAFQKETANAKSQVGLKVANGALFLSGRSEKSLSWAANNMTPKAAASSIRSHGLTL